MSSQFFVERYAREKHQAYLREAAHDRLPGGRRLAGHSVAGRPLRVQAALAVAAMVAVLAVAASTRLVLLG